MPRPEFSLPGTKGAQDKVATQEAPAFEVLDLNQTGSLAADSIETVEVYAPQGQWYNVQSMKIWVNPDAEWTQGNHKAWVESLGAIDQVLGESDYSTKVKWTKNQWTNANNRAYPSDGAAAQRAVTNLRATSDRAIVFNYQPSSVDAPQENERRLKFIMDVRKE